MMRDVRALSNRCCERIFLGSERRMLTRNRDLRPVRRAVSKHADSNNPRKNHISGVKLRWAHRLEVWVFRERFALAISI